MYIIRFRRLQISLLFKYVEQCWACEHRVSCFGKTQTTSPRSSVQSFWCPHAISRSTFLSNLKTSHCPFKSFGLSIGPIGSHWITLDHIGSHWPGVATEAAGCSTSVPLRTRPSRWMTLLHFARLFFEVIVKRATYTATWRLVRSDE